MPHSLYIQLSPYMIIYGFYDMGLLTTEVIRGPCWFSQIVPNDRTTLLDVEVIRHADIFHNKV